MKKLPFFLFIQSVTEDYKNRQQNKIHPDRRRNWYTTTTTIKASLCQGKHNFFFYYINY